MVIGNLEERAVQEFTAFGLRYARELCYGGPTSTIYPLYVQVGLLAVRERGSRPQVRGQTLDDKAGAIPGADNFQLTDDTCSELSGFADIDREKQL